MWRWLMAVSLVGCAEEGTPVAGTDADVAMDLGDGPPPASRVPRSFIIDPIDVLWDEARGPVMKGEGEVPRHIAAARVMLWGDDDDDFGLLGCSVELMWRKREHLRVVEPVAGTTVGFRLAFADATVTPDARCEHAFVAGSLATTLDQLIAGYDLAWSIGGPAPERVAGGMGLSRPAFAGAAALAPRLGDGKVAWTWWSVVSVYAVDEDMRPIRDGGRFHRPPDAERVAAPEPGDPPLVTGLWQLSMRGWAPLP